MTTDLSIIIVSYNTRSWLEKCLAAVYQHVTDLSFELFVVDNGSIDGSPEMVTGKFPHAQLINNRKNLGFARACNQAISLSQGRHVLLLNSDVEILPKSLTLLVAFLDANVQAAVAGPTCLNSDGSAGLSYGYFPTVWMYLRDLLSLHLLLPRGLGFRYPSMRPDPGIKQPIAVHVVIGACMIVRRKAIETVGLLDERFFAFSEEVDWCYRFHQSGWKIYFVPQARVVHHGGKSFEQPGTGRHRNFYTSLYRFFRKHYGLRSAKLLRTIILLSCYKRIFLSCLPLPDREKRYELAKVSQEILQAHGSISIQSE